MLCALILYMKSGTYSFKVDSEWQIFKKLFIAILFQISEFLPEIYWEEVAEEIFVHYILDYGGSCGNGNFTTSLILKIFSV